MRPRPSWPCSVPTVADPDAMTGLVDDDPPFDDSERALTGLVMTTAVRQLEEPIEWEQTQAEWIATGFPGCEPAFPVARTNPAAVDEDS